ncbi:MAG: hypothetical protein JWM42_3947 [Burkholderia sp.]|nr:hypothetical protein [Burkholderia sp.]
MSMREIGVWGVVETQALRQAMSQSLLDALAQARDEAL